MANEINVRQSLQIRKASVNVNYQSQPTVYTTSYGGSKGPTPGALMCSIEGTDVDLTQLDEMGGLCLLQNRDPTNFVTVGIWDQANSKFLPLLELLPGEIQIVRLSRELGLEYGTGTGTDGSGDRLRIKADANACVVLVEAFDP